MATRGTDACNGEETMSLFKHLAYRRPERLAQRSITFLLREDEKLKMWLAELLWKGVSLPAPLIVQEEQPDELMDADTDWRADVVFRSQADRKNIELKGMCVGGSRGRSPRIQEPFGPICTVSTYNKVSKVRILLRV